MLYLLLLNYPRDQYYRSALIIVPGGIWGPETVPGEDFEVQNSNLTSKIAKSGARTPTIRKNRSGTIILVFRVSLTDNPDETNPDPSLRMFLSFLLRGCHIPELATLGFS